MELAILKIVVLFCLLIIPLRGPSKRKTGTCKRPEKTEIHSNYGINEEGELEEILNENKEK